MKLSATQILAPVGSIADPDDEEDNDDSTVVAGGIGVSQRKHDATIREMYEYERDQLLHRYAPKFPGVVQLFNEHLKNLEVIKFNKWGSTSTTALPAQNGKPLDVLSLAAHVMRGVMDRTTRMHQDVFLRMFEKLPSAQHIVEDMFWYFFIEIFALAETEKRFNKHRLELIENIKNSEGSRVPQKKSKRQSAMLERSRSFLEISGKLQSAEAQSKRGTKRRGKDNNKQNLAARLAGGRLNFGSSSDEEEDEIHARSSKKLTGDEKKEMELRQMKDLLRRKFEARQSETFVAPHVLTPRDVSKLRSHDGGGVTAAALDGRGRRSPGLDDASSQSPNSPTALSRSPSVGSSYCGTVQSMPQSAASFASTPRSIGSSSSDGGGVAGEAARHNRIVENAKKTFFGEIDVERASEVLDEAEELDFLPQVTDMMLSVSGAGGLPSPGRMEKKRADELTYHAIDLIRREQHRMFGRMSESYVNIFRAMKPSQQTVLIPKLPDFLARMIVQTMYAQIPYARDLMTRRMKKRIKKKISYWVTGIADSQLNTWTKQMSTEIPLEKVHMPAPPSAAAFTAFGGASQGSSAQRRTSVVTMIEPTKPSTALASSALGPTKGRHPAPMHSSINSSSMNTKKGGTAPVSIPQTSQSDPISHLQRHGAAIFPRAKRGRPTRGEPTPSAVIEATFQDVPVVQENNADSEYRRAFDELTTDFDRLARGESIAQITGSSSLGASRGLRNLGAASKAASSDIMAGSSGYESKKKKESQDPRHVENHRHAACNKRAELWHEYGRPNHHVSSQVNPLQLKFNLRTVSPFMLRFLAEKGVTLNHNGPKLLMKWSS